MTQHAIFRGSNLLVEAEVQFHILPLDDVQLLFESRYSCVSENHGVQAAAR